MEEGGWAGPEVWKKTDGALADGGEEQSGVSMNLPLLENLFFLEEIGVSRKANNWEDSIRRSFEEISGLSPHTKDSVLGEVKVIYKLFKVHLIFALDSGQGDLIKVMSNNLENLTGVKVDNKDLTSSVAAHLTVVLASKEMQEEPKVVATILLQATCHKGEDGSPIIQTTILPVLRANHIFQCE